MWSINETYLTEIIAWVVSGTNAEPHSALGGVLSRKVSNHLLPLSQYQWAPTSQLALLNLGRWFFFFFFFGLGGIGFFLVIFTLCWIKEEKLKAILGCLNSPLGRRAHISISIFALGRETRPGPLLNSHFCHSFCLAFPLFLSPVIL